MARVKIIGSLLTYVLRNQMVLSVQKKGKGVAIGNKIKMPDENSNNK